MNPELGSLYDAAGEVCVEEAPNYSSNCMLAGGANEIGLGFLEEGFPPQNNYDFDSCSLNFVNLLNMASNDCSGLGSSVVYEPVELQQKKMEGEPVRRQAAKNFVTERQRRQTFNDKFVYLRSLLPNPNKNDRASIVGDAIEYIKELTRTVKELNILVDKKRRSASQRMMMMINKDVDTITTTTNTDVDKNESLRSSWLQRRCNDTEIDVRIVHDDVTIKLVQRKKLFNLLLHVSRTFDELSLDLIHVTGGHVGDYCTFLFNTKIPEGSSLYAGAIANRLIHVLERQHAVFHSI